MGIRANQGDRQSLMNLDYEWVQREPMAEYESTDVCQWVLTLRCFGWRGSKEGDPEAVAFLTESVPTNVCKPIADYTSEDVEAFSEAIRRIRKWDNRLKEDVRKQLYPKHTIPGWNNDSLKCDT